MKPTTHRSPKKTLTPKPSTEKIQKVLARAGLGSRRKVESWIEDGRIAVNGEVATLGDRMTLDATVTVDGRPIHLARVQPVTRRVMIYHKNDDEICTASDPEGRPTVFRKLPRLQRGRWIMIGRLDFNTQGLLLFTNDGELAYRLQHPRYRIKRTYAVRVFGEVTQAMCKQLCQGVKLADGMAKFEKIEDLGGEGSNHWYCVSLREGRQREVRRLWESQNVQVSRLIRIGFANVTLPRTLPRGSHQELTPEQIQKLAHCVDLD